MPRPGGHAELGELGQRRDAGAQIAGRAVDQPQRGAVGAERARDALGERRQQLVELDLARDHRAEVGQELEPLARRSRHAGRFASIARA